MTWSTPQNTSPPSARSRWRATRRPIIGLWFNGQKHFGSILPRQTERQERPLFQEARRWLDVYFSGRAPDHLPPLRYDSTPFRRQVCEIMLTIPYGSTMTYGQIAAEVARRHGLANMSAQAVGGAVGHNPISLMIRATASSARTAA